MPAAKRARLVDGDIGRALWASCIRGLGVLSKLKDGRAMICIQRHAVG